MTELKNEAGKKYPIGTAFIAINTTKKCIAQTGVYSYEFGGLVELDNRGSAIQTNGAYHFVYAEPNQWAEILPEQKSGLITIDNSANVSITDPKDEIISRLQSENKALQEYNHACAPYIWAGQYVSILKNGDSFPYIKNIKESLSGRFRIVLKLTEIRSNLYVNGKPRLTRKSKFSPITVYKNTRIIEGTDAGIGGSNGYPNISFKEGYCIVEVITEGFPHMELDTYKMKIEILEFDKLND